MESQETRAPNGKRDDDAGRTLGQRVDRASDTAQQAWSRTRDAFGEIRGTLDIDGRMKRHPYGTLAAAVGIGYVLGGGLFTRLTGRILGTGLRIGLRLATIPMLKDELLGFAESLGNGAGQETGGGKRRTNRPSNKEKET